MGFATPALIINMQGPPGIPGAAGSASVVPYNDETSPPLGAAFVQQAIQNLQAIVKQGLGPSTISTLTNAAGQTLTVTDIMPGLLKRSGAVTVSDITPTAALIVASVLGSYIGEGWEFTIANSNSGVLTISPGTGVTITGTATIAAGSVRRFVLSVTNPVIGSEAVTIQSMFTASL